MLDSDRPNQNHLLTVLPSAEYERIFPHLEFFELPLGYVLYESGTQMRHVYFPTTAIVSLLYVMENGASAGRNRPTADKLALPKQNGYLYETGC